jgi:hypothetical protein
MSINPLITSNLRVRLLVVIPVAVEKLAPEKSTKIRTRQEAPQTIFSGRLDIFHLPISGHLKKKGVFQQPPLFSTPILPTAHFRSVCCLACRSIINFPERRFWKPSQEACSLDGKNEPSESHSVAGYCSVANFVSIAEKRKMHKPEAQSETSSSIHCSRLG